MRNRGDAVGDFLHAGAPNHLFVLLDAGQSVITPGG
jgi:hypothetical protein